MRHFRQVVCLVGGAEKLLMLMSGTYECEAGTASQSKLEERDAMIFIF